MTTTYELYTNENGTPKAVEGKAPAIIERVEALETDVTGLDTALAGKAPMSHTHTIANVTGLQADLTTIRESITNVSSKVDGVGDTLFPTYAKKQGILDACDKALNGANPVHAGDPTLDEIKLALATIQAQLGQLESRRYVKKTGKSSDGTSWYRKWSDGWIEQGGYVSKTGSGTLTTQFNHPYKEIPLVSVTNVSTNEDARYAYSHTSISEVTITNFSKVYWEDQGGSFYWYACGY